MNVLYLCLALGPPAIYLFLLGLINLAQRPLLVSGARDTALLGLAVSGLVIVGPMRLFFPEEAAMQFGDYVWVLLLAFYALCVLLVLLTQRPRLVVYNISGEQLRPVLAELAARLDPQCRWAGDSLAMPGLGIQLQVDEFSAMRNVSLTAVGSNQNLLGWRRLELAFAEELRAVKVAGYLRGTALLCASALIAAILGRQLRSDPRGVAQAIDQIGQTIRQMLPF